MHVKYLITINYICVNHVNNDVNIINLQLTLYHYLHCYLQS